MNSMANISPIDGRYKKDVNELAPFFSESALMKYRIKIEIEYLISLSNHPDVTECIEIPEKTCGNLRSIYTEFSERDASAVKKIESEINHDVKAVEYFIKNKISSIGIKIAPEWIHFALTSEDINNLAYSLMWQDAVTQVYLPVSDELCTKLVSLTRKYADIPLLALTHGQPATPTSLGKELAVFATRLERQLVQFQEHKLQGKFGGATGSWSAHIVAFPNVDWIKFTEQFVSSLGLEPNLITTQIEPHDSLAESYHILIRINSILLDLCRDVWQYISRGVFGQKINKTEVGSSTMPHKVNPIQFENAEGNLGIANACLSHLSQKLPVSRMQRDLSDSTVLRNQGVPLAHSLLACKNILKGLNRLTINNQRIEDELNDHWEVLTEAIQTILRKIGKKDAYDLLKAVSRGQKVTKETLHKFIYDMDIPEEEKKELVRLTPSLYTGLASRLAKEL